MRVENGQIPITKSRCEKLIGIKTDIQLKLNLNLFLQNMSHKLNGLSRIVLSLCFPRGNFLVNPSITSQFLQALSLWIFHNRKLNHIIHISQVGAPKQAYKYWNSTFDSLLVKGN